MVCIICKKTEEGLKKDNLQEISDIDKVISIIEGKINVPTNNDDSEYIHKDSNNCMGENGKYCKNCNYIEPVDGVEYFWCKMYKKSFSFTKKDIKQLNKEIDILKLKRKELEGVNLKIIEMELNNNNEKYTKIMLSHLPDFSKQDQHLSIYICEKCNSLFDKIIDKKISERMNEIIENVKIKIKDDEDEDNEDE